ncbi:hypothetical protein OROMI_022199 [Orobanche minor]
MDGLVCWFDLRCKDMLFNMDVGNGNPVSSISFKPGNEDIIYVSAGNEVNCFDLHMTASWKQLQNYNYNKDEINQFSGFILLVLARTNTSSVSYTDLYIGPFPITTQDKHSSVSSIELYVAAADDAGDVKGSLLGGRIDELSVHPAYPCDFPRLINSARNKDTRDFDAPMQRASEAPGSKIFSNFKPADALTLKTTRPIPKSPSNIVPSVAASSNVTNATLDASKSVHLQFGSISHLETHEELRFESSPDQRVHPSVQSQTQPISSFPPNMPMKLYRRTYKAALCHPSSSVPLSSTQVPPSSQPPRLYSQVTEITYCLECRERSSPRSLSVGKTKASRPSRLKAEHSVYSLSSSPHPRLT